jgi:tight adherence protein B
MAARRALSPETGGTMVFFLVFITAVLVIVSLYLLVYGEKEQFRGKVDKRLEGLLRSKAAQSDEALQILKADIYKQISPFSRFMLDSNLGNQLYKLIEQADVNIRPLQLVALCFGLAVSFGGISWYARGSWFIAGVMAVSVGALPIYYVRRMRRKRMEQVLEQLPDALDLITRALRAGHAFTGALQTVATEMPDPIAKEFRRTSEETNLGMSMKASLEHLTERVPLLDLRLAVTAILIQRETGGNLAEILENISDVIRDRFRILGQVRVYTAQGRMTGWVIGAIPFFLAFYIYTVNPEYMSLLYTHSLGRMMLYTGLAMELVGILLIRKIVNIKV